MSGTRTDSRRCFRRCFTAPRYSFRFLSLRAFPTTHTELKDIANPPSMGLNSGPPNRYSTPAATGMPNEL